MRRRLCRWFGHQVETLSRDVWDFPVAVRCRRCGMPGTATWVPAGKQDE